MTLIRRCNLRGDPASLAWHFRVELWHLRVDNANSIIYSKNPENGQNIIFFKYPSIQVRTLFYFWLKSMNKITATEYFEDYSKKYEEYEEYLTEAKEVMFFTFYKIFWLQRQIHNRLMFSKGESIKNYYHLSKNHHKTENVGLETVTFIMSITDT